VTINSDLSKAKEKLKKLKKSLRITHTNKKLDWDERIIKISNIFNKYSAKDIAKFLFISSLWLPNNGSKFKHQYLTTIFSSIPPDKFTNTKTISRYKDFVNLCKKIYRQTPEFPTIEDYYPAFDWGSIRYPFEGKNHNIFYGTEISNLFDYLKSFEIIYITFDEEYEALTGNSPKKDFKNSLILQDKIINYIDSQPLEESINDIPLGHIEIASEEFWVQAKNLFDELSQENIVNRLIAEEYIINLGTTDINLLASDKVAENALNGALIPAFYIRIDRELFPILPRRYSEILIENWEKLFSKFGKQIEKAKEGYQNKVNIELAKFLKVRFPKRTFFPIVSACHEDGRPHDLIYFGYLISENKLNLFYCLRPNNNPAEIEKELGEIKTKLEESIDLISKEPITLVLHSEGKNIEYRTDGSFEIKTFLVLPLTTINPILLEISKDKKYELIFLDQFLAILDEIEKDEEFSEFQDYLVEYRSLVSNPITTLLDIFGSFRDTSGVLVPGARVPNMIMLDPSWGANFRYESLKYFWNNYPEIDFLDNPRHWRILKETQTRTRLVAKSFFGFAIYFKVFNANVFITSPLEYQKFEQGLLSNLIAECIEDYLSRHKVILGNINFFSEFKELRIFIFPDSIREDENFHHLSNLDPGNDYWVCDYKYLRFKCLGIRLVFNEKKIAEYFSEPKSNNLEIELLIEILSQINYFSTDAEIKKSIDLIIQNKGNQPRFSVISKPKMVAFPEFVNPDIPQLRDHKLSRKIEAEIASQNGIMPGNYQLDQAKRILDKLRNQMIRTLEREILKFDFEKNIGYLVSHHDALINKNNFAELNLKDSKIRDIDYSRIEELSSSKEEFISHIKDYRYIIEKLVQLKPNGGELLNSRKFKYLVALVDKINEIYSASDNLHYQLFSVGLEINSDFILRVQYKEDLDEKRKIFNEEQAKIDLGLQGNVNDQIGFSPIEDILDEIDKAFYLDFEFGFSNMINVLQIMSGWPYYLNKEKERPFYISSLEKIGDIAQKNIQDFEISETESIIKFLTLKQDGLLTIIDKLEPANDLPVWENYKRPFRYSIKPLIKHGHDIYWGPHSTTRSGMIWLGNLLKGRLPIKLNAPNVINTMKSLHEKLDDKLEEKAREISRRFTSYVENVDFSRGTHPQEIGEYDALVYLQNQNTLLNIECKNIDTDFCLKDSRNTRRKVFRLEYEEGRKVKNPGDLVIVEKRETWLRDNYFKFASKLNWPIKKNPRIISIFLTRRDFWWTKFPTRATSVEFMRIDILEEFIANLVSIRGL